MKTASFVLITRALLLALITSPKVIQTRLIYLSIPLRTASSSSWQFLHRDGQGGTGLLLSLPPPEPRAPPKWASSPQGPGPGQDCSSVPQIKANPQLAAEHQTDPIRPKVFTQGKGGSWAKLVTTIILLFLNTEKNSALLCVSILF